MIRNSLSIVIIDSNTEYQFKILNRISEELHLSVCGCYNSFVGNASEVALINPDVVIYDNLDLSNTIKDIQEIRNTLPNARMVIFAEECDCNLALTLFSMGITAFIRKPEISELIQVLDSLYGKNSAGYYIDAELAKKIIDSVVPMKKSIANNLLTSREKEIMQLISEGFLYKEIAFKLGLSFNTIKVHINNLYRKLEVQNKIDAINSYR